MFAPRLAPLRPSAPTSTTPGSLFERVRGPFTNFAYYRGRLSPDTYVDRDYAPKALRLQALVNWAQNVTPAILQVRANLVVPMPATFVELAIGYFRGMAVFLRPDVPPIL